jgi:mannose-6-phosphate isomerase-like protein (cupin superfamily)
MQKVNLKEKLSLFDAHWTPKIVGELNGQYVKLAKLQGEFVWHDHEAEDEMFMVIQGTMTLQFRDREIVLHEGEFCIVPRGVEHKPVAENEVHVMLFEPKATLHTGNVQSDKTVTEQEWI